MVEQLSGDKRMPHHLSTMNSVQKLSIIPSITVVHLDSVWLEIGLHSKYGTKREWFSYRALEMESNLPIQIKFLSANLFLMVPMLSTLVVGITLSDFGM